MSRKEEKITMESILLEDRQRMERLIKEKSSEIQSLSRSLNEERKMFQGRIREVELELEMSKYCQ